MPRLQYVTVFDGTAPTSDSFMTEVSNQIYKQMQNKDNSAMPNDHVSKALFQLTCRSMKDSDAANVDFATSMVNVVSVEEDASDQTRCAEVCV